MIRIYTISILFLFFCNGICSQQMPAISQLDRNLIHLNPASTGYEEVLAVGFMYRSHWTGFKGAPSNQVFTADAPLKNPSVALGLLLENENSGSTNYTGVYINYAYRLNLGPGKLSFGLKMGINAGSQGAVSLRDDDFDRAFNTNNSNFIVPNFGFGMLYRSNNYWGGLSIPRIFGMESKASGKYKMKANLAETEYFIMGGGKLNVNPDIAVEPSALIGFSGAYKTRITINALGTYKFNYKAGLGCRVNDALILLIGYNLNRQFSLRYSYDIAIGALSKYASGSHEINIQYKFGYRVNASNPRRF